MNFHPRWWFQICDSFTPKLGGRWTHFDGSHIFQMGWWFKTTKKAVNGGCFHSSKTANLSSENSPLNSPNLVTSSIRCFLQLLLVVLWILLMPYGRQWRRCQDTKVWLGGYRGGCRFGWIGLCIFVLKKWVKWISSNWQWFWLCCSDMSWKAETGIR